MTILTSHSVVASCFYSKISTTPSAFCQSFLSSLVARKLGISFFEYVGGLAKRGSEADRLKETGTIPSLATLIRIGSALNPLGWSWQPE